MKNFAVISLTCASLMMTNTTASPEAGDAGARFRALADQYFSDMMFHYGPTNATFLGFHQYDMKLEDYSRAGVDAEIAALKEFEWKFDDFSETGLDESTQGDLAIMRSQVRSNLLELETIRPVGKESRHVFERDHEQRLCPDGARLCAGGRAAALADCAREADAGGVRRLRGRILSILRGFIPRLRLSSCRTSSVSLRTMCRRHSGARKTRRRGRSSRRRTRR